MLEFKLEHRLLNFFFVLFAEEPLKLIFLDSLLNCGYPVV